MLNLEHAFKFPATDRDWKRKVLIGGVLNIIPLVNLFSIGYAYRLFQESLDKQQRALPEWEAWGDLFIQGLIVFLIGLIYNLASLVLALLHPVLGLLASIAVALLLPAALAQHAMSGNFGQAFQFKEIWQTIQEAKGEYFVAWLVTVAIFLLLAVIATVPVLGWIISAIIAFYAYLVFAVLFGALFSKSTTPSEDVYEIPANDQ